ncbi:hypothetical protein HGRIS_006919 [Hohenbuehelia grisea]
MSVRLIDHIPPGITLPPIFLTSPLRSLNSFLSLWGENGPSPHSALQELQESIQRDAQNATRSEATCIELAKHVSDVTQIVIECIKVNPSIRGHPAVEGDIQELKRLLTSIHHAICNRSISSSPRFPLRRRDAELAPFSKTLDQLLVSFLAKPSAASQGAMAAQLRLLHGGGQMIMHSPTLNDVAGNQYNYFNASGELAEKPLLEFRFMTFQTRVTSNEGVLKVTAVVSVHSIV